MKLLSRPVIWYKELTKNTNQQHNIEISGLLESWRSSFCLATLRSSAMMTIWRCPMLFRESIYSPSLVNIQFLPGTNTTLISKSSMKFPLKRKISSPDCYDTGASGGCQVRNCLGQTWLDWRPTPRYSWRLPPTWLAEGEVDEEEDKQNQSKTHSVLLTGFDPDLC